MPEDLTYVERLIYPDLKVDGLSDEVNQRIQKIKGSFENAKERIVERHGETQLIRAVFENLDLRLDELIHELRLSSRPSH